MSGADPRRRLWWVLALVTGLVVAATTGASLVTGLASDHASAARTLVHPVSALRIDNTGGSVEVDRGPAGRVTLRQRLDWVLSRPRVGHHWDGDTLVVTVSCLGTHLLGSLDCHADLRIEVPADTAVQSVATSGPTTVSRIAGALDLRSASGPIQCDGLRSARVRALSGSGPISLDFAAAPRTVGAESDSGPIDIGLPHGTRYRAAAHSTSGPASMDDGLDDPAAADTVTATSDSGPVDLAYTS
ncbi:DUF4097 family beta strand repeat-containing protein [Streptacidiphilus sp. N1-3]|uniref:DUF4097 family beta strand repeat-containing protein n=1 Tax=Streptacidiphilus alkalitolerans TaxID=3342712 RepID=A0ABV6WUA4_9ACTN